jgi:fructoselysine and glucoselysine-specific PTS system IIA component
MRHVILASHHRFAEGLRDTLDFLGNKQPLEVVCAYVDSTPLEEQVRKIFGAIGPDDEVLILTDVLQGSVNQAFAPYMGPHVFLVAGINVPTALELCLSSDELSIQGIEDIMEMGRQSMRLVNTFAAAVDEDDE